MGCARPKPARLAEKPLQIRNALGLSQTDGWRRLGLEDVVTYDRISRYETGKNEPPLMILLQYARTAGGYIASRHCPSQRNQAQAHISQRPALTFSVEAKLASARVLIKDLGRDKPCPNIYAD